MSTLRKEIERMANFCDRTQTDYMIVSRRFKRSYLTRRQIALILCKEYYLVLQNLLIVEMTLAHNHSPAGISNVP